MKAKDMFEKLGWEYKATYYGTIQYYNYEIDSMIEFSKNKYEIVNYSGDNILITKELHKAISQQVKELGWDNE